MKYFNTRFSWLPQLDPQVWILIAGRFLSQIGSGFTLFYAPIFFVNQVGLSATQVGFALGSGSLTGVIGRILSGSMSDSRFWGRKRTLLVSAAVCAIASSVLAATSNFSTLVVGNLLMGFGIGLYWPATEAVVADLTTGAERREAYALTRLGDNLGLGLGSVLGGILIAATGAYRALFAIDAVSFIVFLGVIYAAISETYRPVEDNREQSGHLKRWKVALGDRRLLVYVLVNVILTTYISQVESTMPLYFKNFVPAGDDRKGFTERTISAIFAWHLAIAIVCQLPVARALRRFSHPQALTVSAAIWAVGFVLIFVTGVASHSSLGLALLGMGVLAIAIVAYTSTASALVTDIAPESLRGVYLSIDALCWAAGYAIGPPLGGWVLDRTPAVAHGFWLALALSVIPTIAILQYLNRILSSKRNAEGNL